MKTALVTGSSGFIGYHLSKRLLNLGYHVVGVDNMNDYYNPQIKYARAHQLKMHPRFKLHAVDISDQETFNEVLFGDKPFSPTMKREVIEFDTVFHLAAQAGVRHSLTHPHEYTKTNIDGTLNILEAVRAAPNKPHLLMASSGSVYGESQKEILSETDKVDQPVALYGATKAATELMAHSYAHLFDMQVTMMRFFSVYGPWGRPDMALFKFTDSILKGETIELFNGGDMVRDFTYVSDIIDGIMGLATHRSRLDKYEAVNIGGGKPHPLIDMIKAIESATGIKAKTKDAPFQLGDIHKTHADISKIKDICGYQPKVRLEYGVNEFVRWYIEHYGGKLAS